MRESRLYQFFCMSLYASMPKTVSEAKQESR